MSQQETPEVLGSGRFRCASSQAMRALGEALAELARPGDLILTVGAGDIYRAGEKLLSETED